jgi:hypothetical protein
MIKIDDIEVTLSNLQLVIKQRFEAIQYGSNETSQIAQQQLDKLYQYFVIDTLQLQENEFENCLIMGKITARR